MDGKKRFRPSASLVISCIALFVAMSGTAVALQGKNTVDSGDIKPGAVKTQDLAFQAVNGKQVGEGSIAASKLVGTHVVRNNFFVGEFTTGHAQCPAGEELLSGGVQLDGVTDNNGELTTHLVASGPDLSDDAPRTWFAQASSDRSPSPFGSMSVFAVCLK